MSFQTPALTDLLNSINSANATAFLATDLVFGVPQVLTGTWQGHATTHNSAIRVSAKPGGKYQGKVDITYDRLKLASLTPTNFAGLKCAAFNVTKVHDLLTMLGYWTGMQFSTDDLENTNLVDNGDDTWTATLTAKVGSVGWVGTGTMLIRKGGAPIDQVISVTSLNGLNYPTPNPNDTFALMYMYPYDFTSYFSTLSPMVPGVISSTQADALVTAFKALDVSSGKALWTNTPGGTQWNLAGATVVSNGLNSPSLPTNPTYKYVMALQLDPGVLVPAGLMYLHYGDPFSA